MSKRLFICAVGNENTWTGSEVFDTLFQNFQYEIAVVTADGARTEGPKSSETNWNIAHMVK